MGPTSRSAAVSPSPGGRYMRVVEGAVWAILAVTALVYYDLWRAVQGEGHIRFLDPAANATAINLALIVPALAAGAAMRRKRVWWRVGLCWVLTLSVVYVLVVLALLDHLPGAPQSRWCHKGTHQRWCLRSSSAGIYTSYGRWDRVALGPHGTADVYTFAGGWRDQDDPLKRDSLCVLHNHPLLPGIVWTHELYRTSLRVLPPTTWYEADGKLRLIFPAPPGKRESYVTGEMVLPLD